MKPYLLLLTGFYLLVLNSCAGPSPKNGLADTYTRALTDFIKAANEKNKTTFDTLYIIKRKNGLPDDFPDIELPKVIENTRIVLVSSEVANKEAQQFKSRTYINLMGWVEAEKAEFIFVTFSNGFQHQYDYYINYKLNTTTKQWVLDKLEFKGPPF